MGAVDKSPDLSPGRGREDRRGARSPASLRPHFCRMHLLSCLLPILVTCMASHFSREKGLSHLPSSQLILHACRSTSLLTLSPFPLKLRVAKTRVKAWLPSPACPQVFLTLPPVMSFPSPLPSPGFPPQALYHPPVRLLKRRSPLFCLDPAGARSLGVGPERSVPDSPSGLSLVSLLRAPTQAAARGTPLSTTCARAPCCAGLAGSPQTRRLPAAREPRWADPSPLAPPPPVLQSLAATEVWGAVGVAASGTAWSPAPTSWATPDPEPR